MAIDVPVRKSLELGQAVRIGVQHAGEVHELGETDPVWVAAVADQGLAPRSVRPTFRDAVAGTQLESCTRRSIAVQSAQARK